MRDYAKLVIEDAKKYAVAEEVFQGDFSKVINACFSDSSLYLFDTFSGFDARDLNVEKNKEWYFERGYHLKKQ